MKMNTNKRKDNMNDITKPKRVKRECDYGDKCYRRNPAHFREFSHRHLEEILDNYSGEGAYPIPDKYNLEKLSIIEQLDIIIEKQLYVPHKAQVSSIEASSSLGTITEGESDQNVSCSSTTIKKEENPAVQSQDNQKSPSDRSVNKLMVKEETKAENKIEEKNKPSNTNEDYKKDYWVRSFVTAEQSQVFYTTKMELDEIWPQADYITLRTPLIESTRNLVNADVLKRCKKGVKIVNVGRGGLIQEQDLLQALDAGQVGVAALDVFEQEPPTDPITLKVIQHPAVIATPHLGASTKEAQVCVSVEIVEQLVDLVKPGTFNTPIAEVTKLLYRLYPIDSTSHNM